MDKDSKQTFTHRKRKWLLLLLLLLVVGGIGFYYWFSHRAIVIEPQDSFPEVTKASKMNDQKLKEYANQRADETAMTVNVYPEATISSANNQGQMGSKLANQCLWARSRVNFSRNRRIVVFF
ncbi:MAG: hypothetical protein ACLSIL_15025 [Enterococcus casseliflavus]